MTFNPDNYFKEFKYILAPMERFTNSKFRELYFKNGADACFTEMSRISALARNNKSTIERIKIDNKVPSFIQLIGNNEKELEKFLNNFKVEEGFLGFNLNLGCPSQDMIKRGFGSALIKRITKVNKLIEIIKKHNYSVSIKLRLGLNNQEKKKKVYLNLIKETNADFYIVHARHAKETYKNPADNSIYEECVKTNKIIIANGDIKTKKQIEKLKSIGVKGVMIGTAAIKNKNIFNELKR